MQRHSVARTKWVNGLRKGGSERGGSEGKGRRAEVREGKRGSKTHCFQLKSFSENF